MPATRWLLIRATTFRYAAMHADIFYSLRRFSASPIRAYFLHAFSRRRRIISYAAAVITLLRCFMLYAAIAAAGADGYAARRR